MPFKKGDTILTHDIPGYIYAGLTGTVLSVNKLTVQVSVPGSPFDRVLVLSKSKMTIVS